jgi:hypothetical protein
MIVVVGGHTRNIGKTTLACAILAQFCAMHWTAFKITQFGHGVCSANGEPCDCETGDHTLAISEERDLASGTDTSRMLASGAEKVFWVRTRQGQLAEAMPLLRKRMAIAENVLLESNSILRFLQPDLYLAVLDPSVQDFKPSALRYLDRADAIVLPAKSDVSAESEQAVWKNVSDTLWGRKPRFEIAIESIKTPRAEMPQGVLPADFQAFLADHIARNQANLRSLS